MLFSCPKSILAKKKSVKSPSPYVRARVRIYHKKEGKSKKSRSQIFPYFSEKVLTNTVFSCKILL